MISSVTEITNKNNNVHSFLKFSDAIYNNDLRIFIKDLFGENISTLDFQSCRSERNWLKYIIKEDVEPYHNVKSSLFHFN